MQVAFYENSSMTSETSAFSECVMSFGLIWHTSTGTIGKAQSAAINNTQVAFYTVV